MIGNKVPKLCTDVDDQNIIHKQRDASGGGRNMYARELGAAIVAVQNC